MEHHRDELDREQQGIQADGKDIGDSLFGDADQPAGVEGPEARVDEQLQAERDDEA